MPRKPPPFAKIPPGGRRPKLKRATGNNKTGWGVESRCGAVAVGWAYLFPPLSSGGALVAQP
jgi:hypothetical protein